MNIKNAKYIKLYQCPNVNIIDKVKRKPLRKKSTHQLHTFCTEFANLSYLTIVASYIFIRLCLIFLSNISDLVTVEGPSGLMYSDLPDVCHCDCAGPGNCENCDYCGNESHYTKKHIHRHHYTTHYTPGPTDVRNPR